MTDIAAFADLVRLDAGLCVVSTLRPDGSVQATVVNAGVLPHPVIGAPCVAFVVAGRAQKLRNLRRDRRCTVVVRAGWRWATVEGDAEIIGPDEPSAVDGESLRLLLRRTFEAAGGAHDDWDEFDRVMSAERRAVVLVVPRRAYTNPGG